MKREFISEFERPKKNNANSKLFNHFIRYKLDFLIKSYILERLDMISFADKKNVINQTKILKF
jgi:hypothetical protein